ncbi:hypothetical protein N8T08_008568 [Aspergillus melleus]|uniref:Uncharacterized protein n=1 Tax=Aspergillus melleus TaxID=138277 RepID=A0ACC3BDJ2_9EURO|nr:hypothetical protein N8T08_008568 [Aspergillus melleus]
MRRKRDFAVNRAGACATRARLEARSHQPQPTRRGALFLKNSMILFSTFTSSSPTSRRTRRLSLRPIPAVKSIDSRVQYTK